MNKLKLLIIGAGRIGSRHLQSLAKIRISSDIFIIDPLPNRLKDAKERYNEVSSGTQNSHCHTLHFSTDYNHLPPEIDVAIIATTSNHRLEAIRSLLAKTHPKSIILEKIVFQNPHDFIVAQKMFEKTKCSVWVNCPRRYWNGYQRIKDEFTTSPEKPRMMYISGSKWGLCCNSIHFLDLFSFITGNSNFILYSDQLDKKIIPAERAGYIEMSGILYGHDSCSRQVIFKEYNQGNMPLHVYFENADIRCYVDEHQGIIRISKSATNWVWEKTELQLLFQSELTHLYVNQIMETGACTLPTFEESGKIHASLLGVFISHIQQVTKTEISVCPIT